MASCFRTDAWKEDVILKEDLQRYVKQSYKRSEIISFMEKDFSQYTWSVRTLDRRLRYFDIYYNDKELEGPGKLHGYRAMHKKIRQVHQLDVPRDLVHAVMYELDPEGLENRAVGTKKRKPKVHFTTKGPNFVHSVDGHDKLMGYQNSTYPLAIYGSIDTATRKLSWLRIWVSNSDPMLVARWYFDHLYETRQMSVFLRIDKGTETGVMATIHAFLRRHHNDMDACETILYGPCTSNQVSSEHSNNKVKYK